MNINLLAMMIGLTKTLKEVSNMKQKFYIEYFKAPVDDSDNPIADTFHCPLKTLVGFLRSLAKAGYKIVHLQELDGQHRVLINKRAAHHHHV